MNTAPVDAGWWAQIWAQSGVQLFAYAMVAGLIAAAWAVFELVGEFEVETSRALRTGGARLLLGINFIAAVSIFLIVATNVVGANNPATAFLVGIAWPVVIRNLSFKLAQPIQSDDLNKMSVLRVEEAYASLQSLSRRLINTVLTRERMRLVNRATDVKLSLLESKARNALIASPVAPVLPGGAGSADEFVNKIMQKEGAKEETKKALLAALILQYYDRHLLEEMIKEAERQPKVPKPAAPSPPTA